MVRHGSLAVEREMRLLICIAVLSLACPTQVWASDIDPSTGAFEFASDAVRVWHLDSPQELMASDGAFVLNQSITPADEASLAPFFVTGDAALEGTGAVHLGGSNTSQALLLVDRQAFTNVAGDRIEISAWVRAEGSLPAIEVEYGQPAWVLADPKSPFGYAVVRLQPTSRATSDGWMEVSTGPIDGSVWGAPIAYISLFAASYGQGSDYGLVDAVELRPAGGTPTPDAVCTFGNRDQVCGGTGDCLFGHCVPETALWGPLPTAAQRQDLGERWIQMAARLTGDRHSQAIGRTSFVTQVQALEGEDQSSRRFFEGMKQAVGSLRDSHTNMANPPSDRTYFNTAARSAVGTLGACFGIVDADVLGGGRAYAVFRNVQGSPLKPGDVLVNIDGQRPDTWLEDTLLRFGSYVPSDPRADPADIAQNLADLVSYRATSITVERCTSATACSGSDLQTINIAVPPLGADELRGKGYITSYDRYGCSPRVSDAFDLSMQKGDPNGNTVYVNTSNSETDIEFDGFLTDQTWLQKFQGAFASQPANVLVDARIGNGGDLTGMLFLGDLLRSTAQPIDMFIAPAAGWDMPDVPQLFTPRCFLNSASMSFTDISCQLGDGVAYTTSDANAPGAMSRIAWLDTLDVSANDLIVRWIKGRPGVQIFGPVPSYGALGEIEPGEPMLYGWGGGPTLQVADTRVADMVSGLSAASWESGHGVDPDVTVAETVSDLLSNKDTLLDTARAWLGGTP